jgi:hypothetical protein
MATIANLNILLTMQDDATKTLSKAQRDIDKLGKSIRKAGAWTTAAVTTPIIAATGLAIKMASDQQEAINAVNEVYGSGAATVLAYGDAAAQSMGLAKAEYLSAAAVFGVYSTAAGLAGQEAAEFANANLQLAADLGSFFNASTEDVTSALQAAYRGEFDALDRYGIMLNQTTLEQFALAEGIHDGNGAMTTQQRILATNAYMQQRAGAATGDFARTSNSLANSQKILRAQIKDVGAQLGNVLLPTVTRVVAVFRELLTRFQGLPESWQRWIVLIALAAAAIGPLLIVLGTLLTVLPAIGAAFAILTGPIGLVVAAIALLTAAYIGNWWGFRDAVDGVASSVSTLLTRLNEFALVNSVVTSAVNAVTGLLDRLGRAFEKTGSGIMSGNWRKALAGIGDLLAAPAKAIGEFVRGIETGFAPIDAILTAVGGHFVDMGRLIQEVFQGDWRGAFDVFVRMITRLPRLIISAFTAIPWGSIGSALVTGVQSLPGRIPDITNMVLEKLGKWGDKIGAWIRDAIPVAGVMLGYFTGKVPDVTGAIIEKLGNLTDKITGWITDAIPTDWSSFFEGITIPDIPGLDTLETALNDVKSAAETIGDVISTAATTIGGVTITMPGNLDLLGDLLESAKTGAEKVGGAISEAGSAVSSVVFAIPAGLVDLVGHIVNLVDKGRELLGILPFIGEGAAAATPAIPGPGDEGFIGPVMIETEIEFPEIIIPVINLETFNTSLAAIPTSITDTLATADANAATGAAAISATIGEQMGLMLQNTTGMMRGFARAIAMGMTEALGTSDAHAKAIVIVVEGALGRLESVGRNAVQGMANGMLSAIAAVQAAALQVALTARQTVEAALQVQSPSRVFHEIGGYLAEGLALGMRQGLPEITSAAGAMATAAGISTGPRESQQMGAGGGFYNYGIINEADNLPVSHLEMRSHAMARRRG